MQTCGPWHHRVKGKMEKGGALYQFLFDSTQYLLLSSCDNRMQGYVEAPPAVDGASFLRQLRDPFTMNDSTAFRCACR